MLWWSVVTDVLQLISHHVINKSLVQSSGVVGLHHILAMAVLKGLEDLIRDKVEQEAELYPGVQGFSIRCIQKFCQEKNMHKTFKGDWSRTGWGCIWCSVTNPPIYKYEEQLLLEKWTLFHIMQIILITTKLHIYLTKMKKTGQVIDHSRVCQWMDKAGK